MSGQIQHTRFDKLLLAPEEYTSVAGGPKHGCKIFVDIVKLRQGSGKDRQGMAVKANGLKA